MRNIVKLPFVVVDSIRVDWEVGSKVGIGVPDGRDDAT